MFSGQTLTLKMIENDFAEINFNSLTSSVNKFDKQTLGELETVVGMLKAAASIKGLLLSSSKSVFVVGADITEFAEMFAEPKEEFIAGAQHANGLFSAIEDLPYPSVAAINGFALGGGFEICLACDSRVMNIEAAVGLPETGLGIIPGWGGTVRLPRLVGFATAAQWISSGEQQSAQSALQAGAVDQLVAADSTRDAALALLASHANGEMDFEERRISKRSAVKVSSTAIAETADKLQSAILGRTGNRYPAPLKAIDLLSASALVDRDAAIHLENQTFCELSHTAEARALVGLFLGGQFVVKQAKVRSAPFKDSAQPITSAAVIGAGIMGGGIAYQNALKGYSVVMKDIAQPALDLGLNEAAKLLSAQVARGRSTPEKMAKVLNNITPSLDYAAIKHSDVVVEAVVEHPKIKAQVLAEVEGYVSEDAIIASNTSTISINLLAKSMKKPERFCGMHFFNPVHKMPLVEIIRGEHSSEETIASVVAYASKMGKTPIVVNDCPGFFVNRVLFPYFAGFNGLLAEGGDFAAIDKVMEKQFGWPMGPAYLLDVVGLDTGHHAQAVMAEGFPDRMGKSGTDAIDVMFENKRLGQKNGKGFYVYSVDSRGKPKKDVDPTSYGLLKDAFGELKAFEADDIIARTMIPMIIETVRCLEEGIVASPAEADMGLVYSLGFPPFRGGVFRYLDTMGVANFVALADKYAHLGGLYQVTDAMRTLAANNGSYYQA